MPRVHRIKIPQAAINFHPVHNSASFDHHAIACVIEMRHSSPSVAKSNQTDFEECYRVNDSADMFRWKRSPHQRPLSRQKPWNPFASSWSPKCGPACGDSFKDLAKEGSFMEIVAKLKAGGNDDDGLKDWLYPSHVTDEVVESPLHTLLQYQPPLDAVVAVIQTMHLINPNGVPEAMCDSFGRTPLHVACAFCCNILVVARLFNGAAAQFCKPASVQDFAYMIPLHWACRAACTVLTPKEVDNMSQVIAFLVQIFPSGVGWKNAAGRTPRELLVLQSIPPALKEALQAALQRVPAATKGKMDDTDDDTLSLRPSYLPNEIYVDDEELEWSVLGMKRASPSRKTKKVVSPSKKNIGRSLAESAGRSTSETHKISFSSSCNTRKTIEKTTASKQRGVSVDMYATTGPVDPPAQHWGVLEDMSSTMSESGTQEDDGTRYDCVDASDDTDSAWCSFEASPNEFKLRPASTLRSSRSVPMDVDRYVPDVLKRKMSVMEMKKHSADNSVSVSTTQVSSSSNMDIYEVIQSMEQVQPNTATSTCIWI